MIKLNKTLDIPIILTGCKIFRSKRPIVSISIVVRLQSKTIKDIYNILKYFLTIFLKKRKCKNIINLSNNTEEKLKICRSCGGDVRKIMKYLEMISSDDVKANNIFLPKMEMNNQNGPTHCLYRVLKHNNNRTIKNVINDIELENILLPFGIHYSYIKYVNYIFSNSKIQSVMCKNIAELFAVYSQLTDIERNYNMWELKDISNILVCWGPRVLMNTVKSVKNKNKKYWWVDYENNKKQGDDPINTTCISKTLHGNLKKNNLQNISFKMIYNKIGHYNSWKPKMRRGTIQLLKIKDSLNENNNIKTKKLTQLFRLVDVP